MVALGTENFAFIEIDDKTKERFQFFNKMQCRTADLLPASNRHQGTMPEAEVVNIHHPHQWWK